jgi:hypothetical protein
MTDGNWLAGTLTGSGDGIPGGLRRVPVDLHPARRRAW